MLLSMPFVRIVAVLFLIFASCPRRFVATEISHERNPCCSYPCQNEGICVTKGQDYECDCTGTGFSGKNCDSASLWQQMKDIIRPGRETLQYLVTHYPWLWWVVHHLPSLHQYFVRYIYISRANMVDTPARYTSAHEYLTLLAYYNSSYYARSLPPVPENCPTPMGTVGPTKLPEVDLLVDKFFRRQSFIPEPHGSNVLFAFYAQHFTHQFFHTNLEAGPEFTLAGDGVDVSHIYGRDLATQNMLRSFKDGKLKSQIKNGEEFPPYLRHAPVQTSYPPGLPDDQKFALGHPFYGLLPGLFAYSTIWLREHNRVCEILKKEHPEWDDEQLYQTGRLIILGETLKITIEDYVQHLSQYNFKLTFQPELVHNEAFQYSNKIRVEFNHLYHWHPLFPEGMNISHQYYPLKKMLYNVDIVFRHGITNFVEAMVKERAGADNVIATMDIGRFHDWSFSAAFSWHQRKLFLMGLPWSGGIAVGWKVFKLAKPASTHFVMKELTHHNHGHLLLPVLKQTIHHGRQLRLQPLNQYRRRFGLTPFRSFLELTGDESLAKEVEELYGSIDAVEFYPGLLLEAPGDSVTPPTMVEIGGPYSVKGLIANPLCSPAYWKPSTFGGEVGFHIVKAASLEKLFCQNLKGKCPRIAFTVDKDWKKQTDTKIEL